MHTAYVNILGGVLPLLPGLRMSRPVMAGTRLRVNSCSLGLDSNELNSYVLYNRLCMLYLASRSKYQGTDRPNHFEQIECEMLYRIFVCIKFKSKVSGCHFLGHGVPPDELPEQWVKHTIA